MNLWGCIVLQHSEVNDDSMWRHNLIILFSIDKKKTLIDEIVKNQW